MGKSYEKVTGKKWENGRKEDDGGTGSHSSYENVSEADAHSATRTLPVFLNVIEKEKGYEIEIYETGFADSVDICPVGNQYSCQFVPAGFRQ